VLKKNVSKALNDQWNAEYYSAYLYLAMSAYAEKAGFKGAAHWLFVQGREEMAHGTHIFRYLQDRGEDIVFSDIKAVTASYKDMKEVFAGVVAHEKHVTDLIDGVADIAMSEKDHATYNFILWYVNEQVEEVANAEEILKKLNLIGNDTGLLYNLDAVLAQRLFVNPFPADEA
jgi:ferritin